MEGGSFNATGVHVVNSTFRQGHDFHGPVTIQVPAATTAPSSIYDVPDFLSPHFLGREDVIAEIQEALESQCDDSPSRCIVYGMHGLGKTQVALKFAEKTKKAQQWPFVFWISAASVDKLVRGFSKLLHLVRYPGREHLQDEAQVTAARSWLEDVESGQKRKWLLVLDNINREAIAWLRENLPRTNSSGKMLITTRTKQTADNLAMAFGKRHVCIALKPLPVDLSVHLLLRDSSSSSERATNEETHAMEQIVSSIGCLPLAIDQAASLMEETNRTVQEMMLLYQSDQVEAALDWENDLSRYEQNSVAATFMEALKQLEQCPPGTSSLLRILAFLDPEKIPIDILKGGVQSTTLPEVGEDEDLDAVRALLNNTSVLHKAIQDLQRLSLLTKQDSKQTLLRIHDVVHIVLRTKLIGDDNERKRWLRYTSSFLFSSFQRIEDPESRASWEQCELYVIHARALQQHEQDYNLTTETLSQLYLKVASYLGTRGSLKGAEDMFRQLLARCRATYGEESANTLDTMVRLVVLQLDRGMDAEAETLGTHTVALCKKVLGNRHRVTLSSLLWLAIAYQYQKRPQEAEPILEEVIDGYKHEYGPEDERTLRAMGDMAHNYHLSGKYRQAEKLELQVVEGLQRKSGTENRATLVAMNNLSDTYWVEGKYLEAKEIRVRVSETAVKVLGREHPDTLNFSHNLSESLMQQGRVAEAMELMEETVRLSTQVLGANHPITVDASNRLQDWKEEKTQRSEAGNDDI